MSEIVVNFLDRNPTRESKRRITNQEQKSLKIKKRKSSSLVNAGMEFCEFLYSVFEL